jgi:hypothetical protein
MTQLAELSEKDISERIAKTERYVSEQNVAKAIAAAKMAHELLDKIIDIVKPGIRESEVKDFSLKLFSEHQIERTWHPPYVRFSEHTLLTFRDKASEDRILQESDIAFIDIGIVKDGIEGDAGRSVSFGNNLEYKLLVDASLSIFNDATAYWQRNNPNGIALYEYIFSLADKLGVVWNLDPAGHLIGAFPHRGWKRGINHFPNIVDNGAWILEIQIKHKTLPAGAFFEDLLYRR